MLWWQRQGDTRAWEACSPQWVSWLIKKDYGALEKGAAVTAWRLIFSVSQIIFMGLSFFPEFISSTPKDHNSNSQALLCLKLPFPKSYSEYSTKFVWRIPAMLLGISPFIIESFHLYLKLNSHLFPIFNVVEIGSSRMFWIFAKETGWGSGEKKCTRSCTVYAKNVASAINTLIELEFPKQYPKDLQNASEREMNHGRLGNRVECETKALLQLKTDMVKKAGRGEP